MSTTRSFGSVNRRFTCVVGDTRRCCEGNMHNGQASVGNPPDMHFDDRHALPDPDEDASGTDVPPASPAYSTPPPDGIPDADDE